MKYNLSKIMARAWANFRKGEMSFGEALHRAWLSAKAEPISVSQMCIAHARIFRFFAARNTDISSPLSSLICN